MYEDEWNRFMRTGQVNDYLAYRKQQLCMENTVNKAGDIHECGYAGFRNTYRDNNKVGTDRGI